MNDELKQQHSADAELRKLIEDAAKLLGLKEHGWMGDSYCHVVNNTWADFNPLDPERGDLMKVAEAAELVVGRGLVTNAWSSCYTIAIEYTKGDYQSLALAVLRAASAVLKARNGNAAE